MTIRRPFIQLSLEALRARIGESSGNPALLEEVRQELAFRKTHGAKRLNGEVEALLAEGGVGSCPSEESPPQRQADPASRGTGPYPSAPSGTHLERRYMALRATFTAEAEVLSRWGMTSLAPPPLRTVVFEWWRETLQQTGEQHPLGLSREDLERDLGTLKNEQWES